MAACCNLLHYAVMYGITLAMEVKGICHKAPRKLNEAGRTKGVIEPQRMIDMITLLITANSFDELETPPNYGFHQLTGDRKGSFAMTVTRNWRMTFTKVDETTIADLDLEDYH